MTAPADGTAQTAGSGESALPTIADVERAATLLEGRLHRTPLLHSETLARETGAAVWLKTELFQKTGSFKPRGALVRLAALTAEERRRGVCAVSAGNHAAALAWAASREEIDCLVVMWQSASPWKMEAARAYGARVDTEAPGPAEAFARLEELRGARVVVHPFDDPLVVAGQGTVGLEIVEELPAVDLVVVPAGGGGLVAGIATAIRARRPTARIVAVEPAVSRALGAALDAGEPIPVEARSVADGLNAPFAGALPLAVCKAAGVEHATVSESEIEDAFRFLYQRAKLAVEPAAAAGVAALLAGRIDVAGARDLVVVVTGGNVAPEKASAILASG